MKRTVTFSDILMAIGQNEIVCICMLLAALMYDMFYLDIVNPATNSLSSIGRKRYLLFFFWCIFSGFSLLVNIPRLYYRCGYHGKFGMRVMYTSETFLVLTVINMSPERLPHLIHIVTAIIFGILAWFAILVGLLHMMHNRQFRILTGSFFILCLIDIRYLLVYKQMALYEFIPLMLALAVMGLTNFTKNFDVPADRRIAHFPFHYHSEDRRPSSPVGESPVHAFPSDPHSPTPPTSQSPTNAYDSPNAGGMNPNPVSPSPNAETVLGNNPDLIYRLTPLQHTISHYAGAIFLVGAFYALMLFRFGLVQINEGM